MPGKSNKYLAKYSDLIGVSFESSIKSFPEGKAVLTGNPCSEDALNVLPIDKKELGLTSSKKLVLIVMGSLGAGRVSDYLMGELKGFKNKDYEVLFISGKSSYDRVKAEKYPDNVKILPFYEGLTKIMKRTDLMVSRAGASTLSEIVALEVPSILIPSPFVANNHQYYNALDLVQKGAAEMIEEANLKDGVLVSMVDKLLLDGNKRIEMKKALKGMQIRGSADIIYNKIKELIR